MSAKERETGVNGTQSRRRVLGLGLAATATVISQQMWSATAQAEGNSPVRGSRQRPRPRLNGTQTVVNASDYGYTIPDATSAIQAALDDPNADVVIIDNVGTEWLTAPLHVNRDNFDIVVESGVTVRAKPGAFNALGATLLTINGRSGISVSGYGATFQMNKQEMIDLPDNSQWRHAINIGSSSNITVEGLKIKGAGGDGVYVGRVVAAGYALESTNIIIRDVTCDDNYRNALSVISVNGLLVEGCAFINTAPQNPSAGIDFEPNTPVEQLTGIVVRDCVLEGNHRFGLLVALALFGGATAPVDILIDRVRVGAGVIDLPRFVYYAPETNDPGGSIEIRDSFFESSPYAGNMSFWSKKASAASITFTRTVSTSWNATPTLYEPISFLALTIPDYGGVNWTDALLVTNTTGFTFKVQKERAVGVGLQDISGNITIVNPNGVTADYGVNPSNITWNRRDLTALPASTVQVNAISPSVSAGSPATVRFTRTSADLVAPLAVRYSITGTALERLDFAGTPGVAIIPPGQTFVDITLDTRARTGPPATRNAVVQILTNLLYTVGSSSTSTVSITP